MMKTLAAIGRPAGGPLLWLAGPVAFMTIFFVIPLVQVAQQSVTGADGGLDLTPYAKVLGNGYYANVIAYTMILAGQVTLICLLIGYPTAYFISSLRSPLARRFAIILMIAPLFTSNIVRSFAWIMLLGRNGVINDALLGIGITGAPLSLLYNDFSIGVGLIYVMLPFMILSIYASLENINRSLLDAASDLGAGNFDRFSQVIWPLSQRGVISGCVIVFALAGSAYVTPMVMSGGKSTVLSMLIYQQYAVVFDARVGGALSMVLLVLTLLALGIGVVMATALRTLRRRRASLRYGGLA